MSWLNYAKRKVLAQGMAGGLGMPGGIYPYGLNLSEQFGGPRWYPYDYDNTFDKMIREQYRYNPSYIPIGESAGGEQDDWEKITLISSDEFLDVSPEDIKIYIIPVSGENSVIALVNEKENSFRAVNINKIDDEFVDDIGKEPKAWDLLGQENDDGSVSVFARRNVGGDEKGVFEINGEPAAPGFHYIWRDGPSPTPSNNATGDMRDNEWDAWRGNVGYK